MDRKRPAAGDAAASSEMAAFTSSLKKSLETNRTLQKDVRNALRSVNREMAENRRMASRLTRELHQQPPEPQERSFPQASFPVVRSLLHVLADDETASAEAREYAQKNKSKLQTNVAQKQWSADPYKPWKPNFFVDARGTVPPPNEDTLKRKRLEEEHKEDRFFPHLSPAWNKQESKLLADFIKASAPDSPIDYEAVARHVNAKRKADADLPMRQPRTAKECEVQHQRQLAEKQPKLSKAEIQTIVEQVQQSKDQIDWEAISQTVGNHRTPWQCFVGYQKAHYSAPSQPNWTPQQDELLLKYIAAQGPQFVLDHTAVDHMCRHLFPSKTRRHVFLRANQSLVNPNLQSTPWSLREERKLVLCQKIYQQAPLHVPVHFPIRSSRSVREKWSRNLDPAFQHSKPFSKEDDELLKRVVQEHMDHNTLGEAHNQCGSAISWADIMKTHFPGRRSEHLRARWIQELATQDEMLRKLKLDLAAQRGATAGAAEIETLDDYVVQVVPKKQHHKKKK